MEGPGGLRLQLLGYLPNPAGAAWPPHPKIRASRNGPSGFLHAKKPSRGSHGTAGAKHCANDQRRGGMTIPHEHPLVQVMRLCPDALQRLPPRDSLQKSSTTRKRMVIVIFSPYGRRKNECLDCIRNYRRPGDRRWPVGGPDPQALLTPRHHKLLTTRPPTTGGFVVPAAPQQSHKIRPPVQASKHSPL